MVEKQLEEKEVDLAQQEAQDPTYPTRNLYKTTKVSIKALNVFIVAAIVALAGVMIYLTSTAGFDITFESYGGSSVESQIVMYGELIQEPEEPDRQDYVFDGWYWDQDCQGDEWDFSTDTVDDDTYLYAKWIEE